MNRPLTFRAAGIASSRRRATDREKGQTLLLVAISLTALLGLAALAIDVTNLYVARSEAQKAADAAALAGAKSFVTTGFTSGGLGDWTSGTTQALACNGNNGYADLQAQVAAAQTTVAGIAPSTATMTTSCNFANPQDPQLTVTITRAGLPTFLGRIWKAVAPTATATAKAEAFNASGSSVPISVASVKPWLIPNCNPNGGTPPLVGPCVPYFVNSANNYVLPNPTPYIGNQVFSFQMRNQVNPPAASQYYVLDLPAANICPSTGATGCGNVGGGVGSAGYLDNIACANTNQLQCGSTVNLDKLNGSPPNIADTISGTQCLTHTTTTGLGGTDQDSFSVGSPVVINGGLSNPNPALQGIANISRSDSIVTVPLFDWSGDPCPTQKCGTEIVMGFLQLGIQDVTAAGNIEAVVLNAVGCNPANTAAPVSGGGISPIPVRLVQ